MGAILANILGNADVVKTALNAIDNWHTSTSEETAAKASAKVKLLQAYAPFKIAQRVLAISFTAVYLISFIATVVMTQANIGNPAALHNVMSNYRIGTIELLIMGFYFGGGAIGGMIESNHAGKADREAIKQSNNQEKVINR